MPETPNTERTEVTDWEAVSRRIRELREAKGWTQTQLGSAVGSSGNYVAQVEAGLRVSELKLGAYASALDVTVPYLRYGVVSTLDADALRAMALEEGRRSAFREMAEWVGQHLDRPRSPSASDLLAKEEEGPNPDTEKATPKRSGRRTSGGKR